MATDLDSYFKFAWYGKRYGRVNRKSKPHWRCYHRELKNDKGWSAHDIFLAQVFMQNPLLEALKRGDI